MKILWIIFLIGLCAAFVYLFYKRVKNDDDLRRK